VGVWLAWDIPGRDRFRENPSRGSLHALYEVGITAFSQSRRKSKQPRSTRAVKRDNQANINRLSRDATTAFRYDVNEILDKGASDSSADEAICEPSAANTQPELLEQDVLSYDASGNNILSAAVSKAVEKFETKETEKLVKEYEFVFEEREPSTGYVADDDFEMVSHIGL
jgi:hypothetical protein